MQGTATTTVMGRKKSDSDIRPLKARLTDAEKDAFESAVYPSSQIEALTNLIKWFTGQSDEMRGVIMGTIPPSLRETAIRMELERMMGREPPEQKRRTG